VLYQFVLINYFVLFLNLVPLLSWTVTGSCRTRCNNPTCGPNRSRSCAATSMTSDGGCSYWQTFVNFYVSDLGHAYTTTGSPQFICRA